MSVIWRWKEPFIYIRVRGSFVNCLFHVCVLSFIARRRKYEGKMISRQDVEEEEEEEEEEGEEEEECLINA